MGKTWRRRARRKPPPASQPQEFWRHGTRFTIRKKVTGGYYRDRDPARVETSDTEARPAQRDLCGDWVPRQISWIVTGPDGFTDCALRKRVAMKHAERYARQQLINHSKSRVTTCST